MALANVVGVQRKGGRRRPGGAFRTPKTPSCDGDGGDGDWQISQGREYCVLELLGSRRRLNALRPCRCACGSAAAPPARVAQLLRTTRITVVLGAGCGVSGGRWRWRYLWW